MSGNSPECFLIDCIAEYGKDKNNLENYRFPQFVFNKLKDSRPEIALNIIGTESDFFYDTKLSSDKWQRVAELWRENGNVD